MMADIIDLAARREARDAGKREELEVAYYGIGQHRSGEDFDFYAEMKSGRRILIGEGLTFGDAHQRLLAAAEHIARQRSRTENCGGSSQTAAAL